jgi:predicted nucleic acid-binding protein
MILADTSIWIDHFRSNDAELGKALQEGQIAIHPFVIAELALGSLRNRVTTLAMLDHLPQVRVVQLPELRRMIEARSLYNLGIGFTDTHLIGAAFLNPPTLIWTRDKPLRRAAQSLGIYSNLL